MLPVTLEMRLLQFDKQRGRQALNEVLSGDTRSKVYVQGMHVGKMIPSVDHGIRQGRIEETICEARFCMLDGAFVTCIEQK